MRTILLSFMFFLSLLSVAQERFVQFVILEPITENTCREIEEHVRTYPGINSVRVEAFGGNFLAFLPSTNEFGESQFHQILAEMNLTFYCYRTGITGVDRITRLTRAQCDKLQQKQQE